MAPRPSPIIGTIVGLLLERPGYGYELNKRLGDRLGPAWRLGENGVYSQLDNLMQKGFVRAEEREMDRPRARERIVYYPTELAKTWFDKWMGQPTRKDPIRNELVAKLAVARPEHLPAIRDTLKSYEVECLAMLTDQDRVATPRQTPFDELVSEITEDAVLDHLHAEIRWARAARLRLVEYMEEHDAT